MELFAIICGFNLLAICSVSVRAIVPPGVLFKRTPSNQPPPKIYFSNDNALILKYENDNFGYGNYKYAYEQSDGTRAEQVGEIRNQGTKDEILAVSGQYRWVSPGGIAYIVRYTADEEGYRPEFEQEALVPYRQSSFSSQQNQMEYQQAPPVTHYAASLIG